MFIKYCFLVREYDFPYKKATLVSRFHNISISLHSLPVSSSFVDCLFPYKMAVGGGSSAVVAIVLILFLVLPCNMVDAGSYIVGDKINGWEFNVTNWHIGKNFKEGDELGKSFAP